MPSRPPTVLNFARLPQIDYLHAFTCVPEEIITGISALSRTVERLENATRFLWCSRQEYRELNCNAAESPRLRNGYLRASLAEFVSIEEMLQKDLADAHIRQRVYKLNDSNSPHFHLVRELRNHEVHLQH